jgi:hypothetical protein
MKTHQRKNEGRRKDNCLRLDPADRLCPSFDSLGIALFPTADADDMGVRVVDNFCEEHIM